MPHISRKTSEMWGTQGLWLFQKLGLEAAVDVVLVGGVAVGLKSGDEGLEALFRGIGFHAAGSHPF